MRDELDDAAYERLAALRLRWRKFFHWSEQQARAAGVTPAQHQLLLAIRASREQRGPTVGDLAETLLLRHHSVVGLVDRAQAAGLVRRERDPERHAVVHVALTDAGRATLRTLSQLHHDELAQLAPAMRALWKAFDATEGER